MTLSDAGTAAYLERRRGIVRIPSVDLLALLEVDDDTGIVGMSTDWPTDTVRLLVTSPTLDPIPDGCEPPIVALADLGGRLRLPPTPPAPADPHLIDRLEAAELIVGDLYQQATHAAGGGITAVTDPVAGALADVRRTIADARNALANPEPAP